MPIDKERQLAKRIAKGAARRRAEREGTAGPPPVRAEAPAPGAAASGAGWRPQETEHSSRPAAGAARAERTRKKDDAASDRAKAAAGRSSRSRKERAKTGFPAHAGQTPLQQKNACAPDDKDGACDAATEAEDKRPEDGFAAGAPARQVRSAGSARPEEERSRLITPREAMTAAAEQGSSGAVRRGTGRSRRRRSDGTDAAAGGKKDLLAPAAADPVSPREVLESVPHKEDAAPDQPDAAPPRDPERAAGLSSRDVLREAARGSNRASSTAHTAKPHADSVSFSPIEVCDAVGRKRVLYPVAGHCPSPRVPVGMPTGTPEGWPPVQRPRKEHAAAQAVPESFLDRPTSGTGKWEDGTPIPQEPPMPPDTLPLHIAPAGYTEKHPLQRPSHEPPCAPVHGGQHSMAAQQTAAGATERTAISPRQAASSISPYEAAGISTLRSETGSTRRAEPAETQGASGLAAHRKQEKTAHRSAAGRAVRTARRASAAGRPAVRTDLGQRRMERLFSGSASASPGRIVVALVLISILASAIGLTIAFVGAAGGSAAAVGGAGYMDLSVVADMKRQIGAEWAQALAARKLKVLQEGADRVTVRYNPSDIGDGDTGVRLDNWNDVFAVWLARSNRVLTAEDLPEIRDIYFAMNPVTQGPVTGSTGEITACLDVINLRAQDAAALFSLSTVQLADIEGWISPASQDSQFWKTLLGWPVAQGEPYSAGYLNVPPGSAAQIVLQEAQLRAGWIYSQERRTQRGYADCSSLVASCYAALGVRLGGVWPTAAEIGRFCDAHGCRVAASEAQPGDIILWGGRDNGRYLGIYHVALYAGDGMMWEASPSAGGVVYRAVREQSPARIIFWARPLLVVGGQWDSDRLPAGVTYTRTITLSTTAYCEACDTIYGEGRTASGTIPQRGTIATSRTKQFAFGTRLYIPGYGYGTVEDTGGFADGTIDLYLGHRDACTCGRDWGRRTLTVYVLT